MLKKENNVYLDTVIVGSGLSALNFVDTYSKNKKKVDVISPIDNYKISNNKKIQIGPLPPQMYNKKRQVLNFFEANTLVDSNKLILFSKNVKAPKYFKYAWSDTPHASLFNGDNFPASSFFLELK